MKRTKWCLESMRRIRGGGGKECCYGGIEKKGKEKESRGEKKKRERIGMKENKNEFNVM